MNVPSITETAMSHGLNRGVHSALGRVDVANARALLSCDWTIL
jgi:hypothetical protein